MYILELLSYFYKVHLEKSSDKVLYLHNNALNRHIYEWWHQKTGYEIQVTWLKESEVMAGLKAITSVISLAISKLLSRGLCPPVRPKKFKIMREAVWGLINPLFRDDFFIDDEKLLKKDLLLYTRGSSNELRLLAYKDAQDSEYECVNINALKIPINIFFRRFLKYHLSLPLVFILRNFRAKHNYLIKEWLSSFHPTAIKYEILLSHYQIGLELSIKETDLTHIPETIILNNYGAKNVIYHWSDMTSYDGAPEYFKSFNLYLIWGKAHFQGEQHFIDQTIEIGCWLKHNFNEYTRNMKKIYEKMGLPINDYKVLAFYDESFSPDIHFTQEMLLDFWQMMSELIDDKKDVIGIFKPKWVGDTNMSANGKGNFNSIKQRCLESGRFYFIDNPREVAVTEVIAISDINITMGMGSPSTIALLCGKIGLYYDTTGNDYHPFTQKYRDRVVFNDKRELFSVMNRITDGTYSPLSEIDESLLEDYDRFRDNMGLKRFREALLKNL
jgi:polysaccharide biosynthesis PFTS motif protein